jgi:hypothetical protein
MWWSEIYAHFMHEPIARAYARMLMQFGLHSDRNSS